jgi:hypothetical protein
LPSAVMLLGQETPAKITSFWRAIARHLSARCLLGQSTYNKYVSIHSQPYLPKSAALLPLQGQ